MSLNSLSRAFVVLGLALRTKGQDPLPSLPGDAESGTGCTDVDQCQRLEKYILGITDEQFISWDDANQYCADEYGSHLAVFMDENDWAIGAEICASQGNREKCWIGLHTGPDMSLRDKNRQWQWIDGMQLDDEYFFNQTAPWAAGEPGVEYFGIPEDCVMLNSEDNYAWLDYRCEGFLPDEVRRNAIRVRAFLCQNPSFVDTWQCLCHCDSCNCEGDPHCFTFDDSVHHYQGQCSYYAVTACGVDEDNRNYDYSDGGLPFAVAMVNQECWAPGRSCVAEAYVTFYSAGGNIDREIKLSGASDVIETIPASNAQLDAEVLYYWSQGAFRIKQGLVGDFEVIDVELYITCFHDARCGSIDRYVDARVRFNGNLGEPLGDLGVGVDGYINVWLAECYQELSCGLCGYYNDDPNDDFRLPDGSVLDNSNQERYNSLGDEEWRILQLFGDSWITPDRLFALESDCTEITIPEPCGDCPTSEVEEYCRDLLEECGRDCAASYEEYVLDSCVFDLCEGIQCGDRCDDGDDIEECLDNQRLLTDSYRRRCEAQCVDGALPRTRDPTTSPSRRPTPSPVPEMTVPEQTAFPTISPTEAPTVSPTDSPTQSPTTQFCDLPTDIVMVVDSGCSLHFVECEAMKDALIKVVEGNDLQQARIGLIESQGSSCTPVFSIEDDVQGNYLAMVQAIRDMDCLMINDPPQSTCTSEAARQLNQSPRDGIPRNIILFPACEVDACSDTGQVQNVLDRTDYVSVVVFEDMTGDAESEDFACFTNNDERCAFDVSGDGPDGREILMRQSLEEFEEEVMPVLMGKICEITEAPTLSPSRNPTLSPSLSPTANPSSNPTFSPTFPECLEPMDLFVIVETGCDVSDDNCNILKQSAIDIIRKYDTSVARFAVIESVGDSCEVVVSLDSGLDRDSIEEIIENLECSADSTEATCFDEALETLSFEDFETDAKKAIVYFSSCNTGADTCSDGETSAVNRFSDSISVLNYGFSTVDVNTFDCYENTQLRNLVTYDHFLQNIDDIVEFTCDTVAAPCPEPDTPSTPSDTPPEESDVCALPMDLVLMVDASCGYSAEQVGAVSGSLRTIANSFLTNAAKVSLVIASDTCSVAVSSRNVADVENAIDAIAWVGDFEAQNCFSTALGVLDDPNSDEYTLNSLVYFAGCSAVSCDDALENAFEETVDRSVVFTSGDNFSGELFCVSDAEDRFDNPEFDPVVYEEQIAQGMQSLCQGYPIIDCHGTYAKTCDAICFNHIISNTEHIGWVTRIEKGTETSGDIRGNAEFCEGGIDTGNVVIAVNDACELSVSVRMARFSFLTQVDIHYGTEPFARDGLNQPTFDPAEYEHSFVSDGNEFDISIPATFACDLSYVVVHVSACFDRDG